MVCPTSGVVIGVDFDNTIASYDHVLHKVAVQHGLVPARFPTSKREIRDAIRRRAGGEEEWQRLQAQIYGPMMGEATLMEGVEDFLARCRRRGSKVFIVSHKSEFARLDATGTNLRGAALSWMEEKGLFKTEVSGLTRRDVFFEATRADKVERIRQLRCTHFIDDLHDVFLEDTFPAGVSKLLFSTCSGGGGGREMEPPTGNWREIADRIIHG